MEPAANINSKAWRRATAAVLLAVLIWQLLWLAAAYLVSGGREYADDVTPSSLRYLADPWMLFSDRHHDTFGAAVAPPLLPVEMAAFHTIFAQAGDFIALRLTMLVHVVAAMGVGFAVAFRGFGVPNTARQWLIAGLIVILPLGWVTSVIMVQDDSIAAGWAAVCLAALVWCGPVAAAFAAGVGMFVGKIFLALAFLALWIAFPRSRWPIASVGAFFVLALFGLFFWRDGGFAFSEYVYAPYMGASAYGIAWLLTGEFDIFAARDVSVIVTALGLGLFTLVAVRRRLSAVSAVTGLHFLFLVTYFGAMPEYYVWFLPFLVVTLWASARRGMWGTFATGWLSTSFAYGYKALYGANSRFAGSKEGLKAWVSENIPFDIYGLQITVGIAAVVSTLLFAIFVLILDPAKKRENVLTADV